MKTILQNENFKELASKFDLDVPELHNILIDDYKMVDGKLVVNSVKVLDKDFNFLRFAHMDKLVGNLHACNVVFSARKSDTV